MTARRFPTRRTGFAPAPRIDPESAWRAMTGAVSELERHGDQPGRVNALATARPACVTAAFPVEGEGAKALSNALLELARVYPRAPEDHRGWLRAAMGGVANSVEALLDQMRNARLADGRRAFGGD